MANAYSLGSRERIMKDDDGGCPIDDLAVHNEVSRSWTSSLIQQRRVTGRLAPRTYRPGRKKKLAPHEQTVRRILLPTLKERDIVVMDNLSSHKVMGVKVAIESMGAKVLYLPPYSLDLNPIENVFSKLKTLVRKSKRRKVDDLWRKLGELCDVFASEKCRSDFKNAEYKKQHRPNNSLIRSRFLDAL